MASILLCFIYYLINFKQPIGSLPFLYKPAIAPYLQERFIQFLALQPTSFKSILILSSHLRLRFPKDLFPSDLSTRNLYEFLDCSIRDKWLSHLCNLNLRFLIRYQGTEIPSKLLMTAIPRQKEWRHKKLLDQDFRRL